MSESSHTKRAWYRDKRIWLSVLAIVLLVFLFWGGGRFIDVDADALGQFFERYQNSPLALPLLILFFVLLSFVAAPQWALMAASVAAFGPLVGGLYAWIATMISASVNFFVGRVSGAKWVDKTENPKLRGFIKALRKNGMLVAFGSRFVPLGPFIFVNMASGASGMRYSLFGIGTGLGIIPKIAAVAFLGQGVVSALSGDQSALAWALVGFILMVAAAIILSRAKRIRKLFADKDA